MKLGAVTIGQAPRNDVAGEFMQALGLEAELLQRGALDGLTLAEIKEIEPKAGDYVLVTRLRDGTEVRIAERHIEERMQACVRKLEEDGAEIIVQFCTGEFPSLTSRKLLLKPDVLLEHLIPAIVGKGCLGAVVPHESQIAAMEKKWGKTGLKVVCTRRLALFRNYLGIREGWPGTRGKRSRPHRPGLHRLHSGHEENLPDSFGRAGHPAPDPTGPDRRRDAGRRVMDLNRGARIVLADCMGAKEGESLLVVTDPEKKAIGEALYDCGRELGLKSPSPRHAAYRNKRGRTDGPRRGGDEESRHRRLSHKVFTYSHPGAKGRLRGRRSDRDPPRHNRRNVFSRGAHRRL